jgi:sortase A
MQAVKLLEFTLWTLGALLIALFAGVLGWQRAERGHEIAAFETAQRNLLLPAPSQELLQPSLKFSEPPARIVATEPARAAVIPPVDVAIAILRIPAIKLEVPVNRGTGHSELLRGAGLVTGSALPGSSGNVSIAAHRDSYFRGLRNIKAGDIVELESLEHKNLYRVTNTKIVEPTEVNVLADVGMPVLTLITCYPFNFVGSAPQRFIVRAVATDIRR